MNPDGEEHFPVENWLHCRYPDSKSVPARSLRSHQKTTTPFHVFSMPRAKVDSVDRIPSRQSRSYSCSLTGNAETSGHRESEAARRIFIAAPRVIVIIDADWQSSQISQESRVRCSLRP